MDNLRGINPRCNYENEIFQLKIDTYPNVEPVFQKKKKENHLS